jgi:transposase-like protein
MTRKRHTEEQIIAVLKDAQAGIGVQELCRKHGISDAMFYKWRAKCRAPAAHAAGTVLCLRLCA